MCSVLSNFTFITIIACFWVRNSDLVVTTDNYSLQDLGLKCSAWKRLCLNYPKLMQIIRNLAEIEALPKSIQNKSSEIRNLFSAEILPLLFLLPPQLPEPEGSKLLTFKFSSLNFVKSYSKLILLLYHHSLPLSFIAWSKLVLKIVF